MKSIWKYTAAILTTLVSLTAINVATASTFAYNKADKSITIKGDINPGDFDLFAKAVGNNPLDKIIITSNGGSMVDSFEIGLVVNANKITVDARDFCFSGCAYIWLASPNKIISTDDPNIDQGYVGIHLPFNVDTGKTDAASTAEATWYFGRIGLSGKAATDLITSSYPNIYVINPGSTQDWGIGHVEIDNLAVQSIPLKPVANATTPVKHKE